MRGAPPPLRSLLGRLLLAPAGHFRLLRAAFGFLWGGLLGLAMLRLLLSDLGFSGRLGVILGGSIVLLLAVGNAASTQVRGRQLPCRGAPRPSLNLPSGE